MKSNPPIAAIERIHLIHKEAVDAAQPRYIMQSFSNGGWWIFEKVTWSIFDTQTGNWIGNNLTHEAAKHLLRTYNQASRKQPVKLCFHNI